MYSPLVQVDGMFVVTELGTHEACQNVHTQSIFALYEYTYGVVDCLRSQVHLQRDFTLPVARPSANPHRWWMKTRSDAPERVSHFVGKFAHELRALVTLQMLAVRGAMLCSIGPFPGQEKS